jgi:Cutinase
MPRWPGSPTPTLSNWGCSVHESFDTWPADYTVLATARNFGSTYTASDGTVGEPYILASGTGLHSFPLSLSPVTQNAAAGSAASVTAQLLDSSTSAAVPGQRISFRVESGPDTGVPGTCPSSCTTDANGQATWSFTGSKATAGATDTVQAWIDTNGDGTPSAGEPQTTAAVNWTAAATSTCANVLYVGARGSGEYGPGSRHWPRGRDPRDLNGFGQEVDNVYNHLRTDLGADHIEADSVIYGADHVQTLAHDIPKYFRDLGTGVGWTMNELAKKAASCPGQEIVLAGYSQGAMVMHRVLHLLGGSPAGKQILSRVAAAVLIGDGDQVPFDHEVKDGSAWHVAEGVGQAIPALSGSSSAKFSSSLGSRVLRVCNRLDIVCDFQNNLLTDVVGYFVHTHYTGSKPLLQAIGQAARDAQTLHYYGGKLVVKGKAGTPVSASAVVIGGKAPLITFVGIDGTVPSWIALGMTGNNIVTLSGTPPAAGSWTFDVEVQDAGNNVVTIPVSLTVTG